ncbi:MAG: beta-galactosidase [Armatimonadota bacterium]
MKNLWQRLLLFCLPTALSCLLLTAGLSSGTKGAWRTVTTYTIPASQTLRGYGRVETMVTEYRSARGEGVWVYAFRCQKPENASIIAGKFLADLTLSDGVKAVKLQAGGREIPATRTFAGTTFIGCADGAEARILCGESEKALVDFAAANPALVASTVPSAAYPHFLDRFDRYGWGVYGVGGFNDYHGWRKKQNLDPTEDVQFLIDNKIRFDGWLDPTEFDFGDGLRKNTEAEWMIKKAADAGQPFSFRVYANAGGANWTARRFPEYAEQPASFLMSGWHGASLFYHAQPHFSWFNKDIPRYLAVKTMEMMRQFNDNPYLTGWMHPHGELAHDDWFDMHDDYSPTAQRSWCEYLQNQGIGLPAVTRMYGMAEQPFVDWAQVPVPEFATFEGLNGLVASLEGTWYYWVENDGSQKIDAAWHAQSPEQKYQGIREQWWNAPLTSGEWKSMRIPDNDEIFSLFKGKLDNTTWFRRSFTLTPAQKAHERLYLYWYPTSFSGLHTGKNARYHSVYINGKKAGEIGSWGALEITRLLQSGENAIALHLLGSLWNGRIYLSTVPPRIFPYLGEDMNRLWVLWKEWHTNAKYLAWRDILDGMRQVDPNRPIKFMAPIRFGTDNWGALATNYGGFGHFTGEGMWFFPWYKRYGFLYDVPGSSETAGPANNLKDQFDSFRRTFLAGLNAHDPVFMIQTYSRNPELRNFWLTHAPVLKQMGRYDLDASQQVLLYRSTKMDIGMVQNAPYPPVGGSREVQRPWDWDIGRGTLQTIGQSYLYVDDGGLADGKMYGYPVMIDSGNEITSAESVKHITAWVRAGGTFVTLPFTGRSTMTTPDSWPIKAITGCEIGRLRTPGNGSVTIGKNQGVFKSLAGKTFPDDGHSTDWQGGEHNLLSVELNPGADSEVLATFENGAPAIVRHRLGKGAVIVLGTAFWRGSKDVMGIWWPQPLETEFMADLLAGIGFPAARCTTDDRLVWPQPYRTNNGLEAVTTLVSWHEDTDATVKVRLLLPRKPTHLVSFGVDGVKSLPFDWKDGAATATIAMPAREVKVLAADVYGPNDAVAHWWRYQQRMWHELAKPMIDFTPYTRGKWADPVVDLRFDAKLTLTEPTGDTWQAVGFDDRAWKACMLGLLNADGAQPQKPVWVRKTFTVPERWLRDGGKTYLISGSWVGPHYLGSARLTVNGQQLHDYTTASYNEFDISKLLSAGTNIATFAFKGDAVYQGFSGNVWLYHAEPAERSMDLAGAWRGMDNGKLVVLTLPGKGKIKAPTRGIYIPKEWEGKYRVRLYQEGNPYSILGAYVNDRLVRRHHHNLGARTDIDITAHLRFGEDNELVLAHAGDPDGLDRSLTNVPSWDIHLIRLDLYPVK